MRKKRVYDENMPVGKLTEIPDFLPPPEKLIFPKDTVKVTIYLDRLSVDFFKQKAKKHRGKYQRMIREVLDRYVQRYRNT
ncbi:MAG: CopG family transcriptional regulator [Candidatus Omnitrophica bacterium]|nr:CopG family transcriptional regulator [Candidatus Omnitrophota bacterium]